MYKKLRKFCAWALAVVTVVSLVPSSGLVMADETDTSVNAEVEQGTIYFKVPDAGGQVLVTTDKDTEDENTQIITVTDEKTTLTDKDGNETDVTLTEEGYSLEITGDVESVVNVEILPAEGYEVGTYHILSDTGDVVDEPEISSENKYEVTISKDVQVVEVLFNAVETQSDTTEETEVVEEPTETEEVTEEVTEPVEETTKESEPVEVEKEAETTSETEDMDAFIEAYMESEERVQKILDENWNLGYSENYLMGIAPNYVGERVYTKGGLGSRGAIDVINYHDPNDWTDHSTLNHWTEGILGTSSEWMFCANPKAHFQAGYKTAVNATKYYTQDTITLVAGVNYYVDHYFCSGLDSTDKYFIKQTFVWRLLNDVNHWYTGSGADRIAFEYGNGLKDNQGHWVADHMNGYEDAVNWVTANKSSLVCSGEIFEGSGQPLSRWSCQYNPTGSGDDSDEVSETETSTAINSLSASARAYNIFDHIGQTVNVQTWHQSQDTDSYKISWVNSNGVVKHRSKQGRLGVVSKLQPPGTYNDDYLLQVMWCGDADISMRTGTRVVRDLSTYYYTGYTQTRLKQAAALFYWWDSHYGDKVSSFQNYYVKQAIVWWIKGSSESGKQGNTPYANWDNTSLRAKQKELWSTGLSWAKSNYQYFDVDAVLLTGENQPLFTMRYTYEPTGSGYIVKTSSNTNLTSGNSNYNLTGATYNIYKTKSDAQNNKNAISGKQFKIASNSGKSNTVELNAGTYYIKEVNGSDGTGYTTSSTIYTITITAGKTNVNLTPSGGIKNTPKTATIDLYKTPSNPVCVENNENYSLEGAVYGVYTNKSCTSLKTKATTNADGEFSVTGLPLGQYWVKEISPSPGYLLDTNVYAVDARTEGSGPVRVFTVESHETPILDPDNLLLKKVDSNTNGAPEDQGTMEGAEFEVKFYGIAVDEIADGTDPATLGYQPTRTWVLKTYTTSNGSAALIFDNAFKVSGDDFYYTSSGDIAFPFGVITMKETKAPNGYLINDQVIVQKITDANGGNDSTIIDHVPTQLEDSLTLRVVKTQYDTEKVIPGVTYRWTRPDGTVNTYTTDKNGVIEFHGLTWGKHTIEEIDVPDGYAVNTNKIEFTVAQDNTITFDKEYPMSDTNGVITISLDTEGNMDVDYTNKPAPFDLKIHKVNNHNFPLEGAEFTLYSDEKCTQVVDVQVTDSDGELTFADLIPYEEYWMKETDAPPGYRIPVNDDGSDIIWKIDVESVPVNDEFTFNVNDTAYTVHSTGSIWIDGTKADRVCNMTVVNEVGMKLPNTGSSMMILLLIAGVMLMGGAIVISRKSRKTSDDKE